MSTSLPAPPSDKPLPPIPTYIYGATEALSSTTVPFNLATTIPDSQVRDLHELDLFRHPHFVRFSAGYNVVNLTGPLSFQVTASTSPNATMSSLNVLIAVVPHGVAPPTTIAHLWSAPGGAHATRTQMMAQPCTPSIYPGTTTTYSRISTPVVGGRPIIYYAAVDHCGVDGYTISLSVNVTCSGVAYPGF
jgi:hypothetical protein